MKTLIIFFMVLLTVPAYGAKGNSVASYDPERLPKWLQYSDDTAETYRSPGTNTYLVEFTMPTGYSFINKMRIFIHFERNYSGGGNIQLRIYNAARKLVWWEKIEYEHLYRGTSCWRPYRVFKTFPYGTKIYVGASFWPGSAGPEAGPMLGVDTDPPQHDKYSWDRTWDGKWVQCSGTNYDYMVAIYITESVAVDPTSLGQVKALYY